MYKCIWTQPDYFHNFINKVLTYIIIYDINILKELKRRFFYLGLNVHSVLPM